MEENQVNEESPSLEGDLSGWEDMQCKRRLDLFPVDSDTRVGIA